MRVVRRDSWTWLVAPALLVGVALLQYRNVAVDDESTWSGVGFGMFATFDNESSRAVNIRVTVDGDALPASSAVLGERAFNLRTLPSASEVRAAAESLLREEWRVVDGIAVPAEEGDPASVVSIEIVGLQMSGTPAEPVVSTKPIRAVEVAAR
jgi:hypothetical protein